MEEAREESGRVTGKSKPVCRLLGKIPFRAVFRTRHRPRPERERKAEPWARIRDWKGSRTLVWGMGDGKTFGSVPLGPNVVFSVARDGVTIDMPNAYSVVIGSRENEEGNVLLARKIEKVLRSRTLPSIVLPLGVVAGGILLAVLLSGSGGLGLGHVASLSQSLPGSGEALPDSSFSPSSMSSGLTCHTH